MATDSLDARSSGGAPGLGPGDDLGARAEDAGPWRRHLPLPGTINVRDVGGYPVGPDGARRTRWRTLLRADALHRLDDTARAELAELGLRTVVDLREDYEIARAPDALGDLPVRVERIRFFTAGTPADGPTTTAAAVAAVASEDDGSAPDAASAASVRGAEAGSGVAPRPTSLRQIYEYLVDVRGAAVAAVVRALAVPGALPALVHCSAGKDRTGITIALLLDVAGVSDADIAADYALTGEYLNPAATNAMEQVAASSGLREMGLGAEVFTSPPELILATLARIRAAHGSARGYLIHHGVPAEELDRLAAALVVDAS